MGEAIHAESTEKKTQDTDDSAEREANDIARRDLAAQQSMALSTEKVVKTAWWQVGIGFGTLFLLIATVYYARAAALAADGANKAASSVSDVGPGVSVEWPMSKPSDDDTWKKIAKRTIRVYARGIIHYEDIFGDKQTTEFCLILDRDSDRMIAYHEGNRCT